MLPTYSIIPTCKATDFQFMFQNRECTCFYLVNFGWGKEASALLITDNFIQMTSLALFPLNCLLILAI